MFQLFHVISQACHQNLKAVRQRRLCYQRKLRSGGHKGKRKTSRCGSQKPKERDGVSLLHVVESFSKMRTESISDFMEHVPTEEPNHLPAPCLHPTDEHCQENHPMDSLSTTPNTSWKHYRFSLKSLLSQQPPCSFHTFPVVQTSHSFFPLFRESPQPLDSFLLIFPIT